MKKYLNDKSYCVKYRQNMSPSTWFNTYKKFQDIESSLVKIHTFEEKELSFEMESIKSFCLTETHLLKSISKTELRQIISKVISLWGRLQTFTVDDENIFIHRDFCICNLMYETDTKQIKLIDPDAFNIQNPSVDSPIYHGPFIDTLYIMKLWERL